jgi:hypothetical protein
MSAEQMARERQLLQAALAYARAGLSVIPIGHNKRPLCPWKPYQKWRAGESLIRYWFGRGRSPNLALVCGRVSGGLLVFDFDHEAAATYLAWRAAVGDLARRLPLARSGKGLHVYLRAAAPGRSRKLALDAAGRVLIETRGEGGSVIAPPSHHALGRNYRWLRGETAVPQVSAVELAEMVAAAEGLDQRPPPPPSPYPAVTHYAGRNGFPAGDEWRLGRYAAAILERESAELRQIAAGSRNDRLNLAAFRLGRYVGAGLLYPQWVKEILAGACGPDGNNLIGDDGRRAFQATLHSGLRAGAAAAVCKATLLARLKGEGGAGETRRQGDRETGRQGEGVRG